MNQVVIFTDEPGWHGQQLRQALAARGWNGEYASLTGCRLQIDPGRLPVSIPGFEDRLPQAAIVRGVPGGSLEQVVFYLDVLHALELYGIPVYNNGRAIEASVDKAMTSIVLNRAGLPTPPTWVVGDRSEALTIAERELKNGHALVSKPLFGSQGEGIRRLDKMTDLFWLTDSHGIYYLQRFIHCGPSGYRDYRVFVINGSVVATMCRQGRSWLNNVAQGAACQAIGHDGELERLALTATAALKMDYAGIDIIRDGQGDYHVIEVNSIPAWKGLQTVTAIAIADALVADLFARYLGTWENSYPATAS